MLVFRFIGPEIEIDWPVVGLIGLMLVIYYFPTITSIVLPGNIEIHREIDRAQELVKESVEAGRAKPEPETDKDEQAESRAAFPERERLDEIKKKVFELYQISTIAAAMEMGRLIETAVVDLVRLYTPGSHRWTESVPQMLFRLAEQEIIDDSTVDAVRKIWDVRNIAIHGRAISDEDIARFVDIALPALEALRVAGMKNWQVSAPRYPVGEVFPKQIVQLGLRRKYGREEEIYHFTCYVFDPKDQPCSATGVVHSDKWAYLNYPTEFLGGTTEHIGIYRVRYEISGILVATDRFQVNPMPPGA